MAATAGRWEELWHNDEADHSQFAAPSLMYPSSKRQNQGRLDSYEGLFSNTSRATAVRVHGLIKLQAMRGTDRVFSRWGRQCILTPSYTGIGRLKYFQHTLAPTGACCMRRRSFTGKRRGVCGDKDDRPQPSGMEANTMNREAGQSTLLVHLYIILPTSFQPPRPTLFEQCRRPLSDVI
jgi:hypothetical protein